MRIIALEEHYRSKAIAGTISPDRAYLQPAHATAEEFAKRLARLDELGDVRIADMDAAGIDLQVLSHTVPSVEAVEPARAADVARRINDEAAEAVSRHPKRLAAFAALPVADPAAAAQELERTVRQLGFKGALINGMCQGRFLDDPFFSPLLECAESLAVPLYLHPAPPPVAVQEAYYAGLESGLARMLSTAGWGWHVEAGLHVLRMIATGVFDRFPRLQVIVGHMGEMIPFFLARSAGVLQPFTKGLAKPFADYVRENVHITTSGIFTVPPLMLALQVMGPDRVMFSVDYPYSTNQQGWEFLDQLSLAPADFEKLTHANAERLLHI